MCLACFALAVGITIYVSLGSLLVYAGLMIQLLICGQTGFFAEMTQGQLIEMYIVFGCLLILAYWKHRENIKRLIHGNERKPYLFKKNKVEVEGEKTEAAVNDGKENN